MELYKIYDYRKNKNINEMQDENSVTIYNDEQYENALKIRQYVEKYNSKV